MLNFKETFKWREESEDFCFPDLLVCGSIVIQWSAVCVRVNSKDPISVLYLSRIVYDFIPAKPTVMRAEAHIFKH